MSMAIELKMTISLADFYGHFTDVFSIASKLLSPSCFQILGMQILMWAYSSASKHLKLRFFHQSLNINISLPEFLESRHLY